ncbi:hypothetical protein PCK1_001057 [Pneumocystis canis]|nr:hypothetical protein PCK1_001057 [Pneumocystis canis]
MKYLALFDSFESSKKSLKREHVALRPDRSESTRCHRNKGRKEAIGTGVLKSSMGFTSQDATGASCDDLLSPPKRPRSSFSESTLHKRQGFDETTGLQGPTETETEAASRPTGYESVSSSASGMPHGTRTLLGASSIKDWMHLDDLKEAQEAQSFQCTDFTDTLSALGMLTSKDVVHKHDISPLRSHVPDKSEQIKMIARTPALLNDKEYIIAIPWMKRYRTYLQDDSPNHLMGPVDQTSLMIQDHLKPELSEGKDFETISSTAWHYLITWFGLKGQPFLKEMVHPPVQLSPNDIPVPTVTDPHETMDSYVFQLIRMKKKTRETENHKKEVTDETSIHHEETMIRQPLLSPLTTIAGHPYNTMGTIDGLDEMENDEVDDEPLDWSFNRMMETGMSEKTGEKTAIQAGLLATPPVSSSPIHLTIRGDTHVSTFLKSIRQALKLHPIQAIQLWHEGEQVITSETILPQETMVKTLGLPLVSELFVEVLNESSPAMSSPLLGAMSSSKVFPYMYHKELSDREPSTLLNIQGTTSKIRAIGLQNLGNSCYMNAALQCLTHTTELTTYFLSGMYRWEVNSTNPLGTGGQIARSYATLLNSLAHMTTTSFSPKAFKNCVGRFNLSFAGHSQQDSQELLAFLLDGMHEDLNRIQKKPYFEKPTLSDTNDALIAETANICWELHRKRNDSVIVDLFHGLYKSVLVCPICDQVSITFDPFIDLYIQLIFKKHQYAYIEINGHDNLLNSACLEFFDVIRRENMKSIVNHLIEGNSEKIKSLDNIPIFDQLIKKYEQYHDKSYETENSKAEDSKHTPMSRWSGTELADIEEENYFNTSDDEDTIDLEKSYDLTEKKRVDDPDDHLEFHENPDLNTCYTHDNTTSFFGKLPEKRHRNDDDDLGLLSRAKRSPIFDTKSTSPQSSPKKIAISIGHFGNIKNSE